MKLNRRTVLSTTGAAVVAAQLGVGRVWAQGGPLRIGMGMAQTGPLGAGGQSALLAFRMWIDDMNAKGGLLGRKLELIAYDDQSNGANTPGIYTKLLDVDKVDLLVAPYATNPTAPIMPLVKERKKLLMGTFSFQVNAKPQHDMWFNNAPWNDARGWSEGFFDMGTKAGAKTAAIVAADGEFQQNLANGAREVVKQSGSLKIVYDQNYPPNSTDFSSIIRAIRASKAEVIFVACYPSEAVAIVRSVNEIGLGSQTVLFGGGMVGLQFTPIMKTLGSLLNGVTNYNSYVPGIKFPGVDDFFKRYSQKAIEAKVDPLGFYLAPFSYATGQMLEAAINGTKSFEDRKIADYLHKNEMQTIVGPYSYDKLGERSKSAVFQAQFRGIKNDDLEQFKQTGKQIVVWPDNIKQGNLITPFDAARKAT
jgi:branched-chain amino acid transport system substrate-binding protein